MPLFADPEHWTFRGGPLATHFGTPWCRCFQGQVQHDRTFYLYAVCPDMPLSDYRDAIRLTRHYAHQFGWIEIIFERIKAGKPHILHIPIIPSRRLIGDSTPSTVLAGERTSR